MKYFDGMGRDVTAKVEALAKEKQALAAEAATLRKENTKLKASKKSVRNPSA